MKTERFEATSVDAAIAKGLQQLRLSSEDVEVQVIQEAKKGFLGFGAKDAIVDLHYTEKETDDTKEEMLDFSNSTPLDSPDELAESVKEEPVEEAAETDVPITASGTTVLPEIEEEVEPVAEDVAVAEVQSEAPASIAEETSEVMEETRVTEPSESVETDALPLVDDDFKDVEYVAEYLIDVLDSYLVEATIEVEDRGRSIIYNIQTDKKGLVIGKHGKIINSLETLAQVMTHQYVRPHVRVTVNVGNYRERRQETLARLARKTADKVSKTKQPVFLEPLPAAERKIIHAQLARFSYISTHSEGKEPHRYLVVSYKD